MKPRSVELPIHIHCVNDSLQEFAELVGRSVSTAGLLATLRPNASDTSVLQAMQETLASHINAPALPCLRSAGNPLDTNPHHAEGQ